MESMLQYREENNYDHLSQENKFWQNKTTHFFLATRPASLLQTTANLGIFLAAQLEELQCTLKVA